MADPNSAAVQAVKFSQTVKHGLVKLLPGVPVAFEDKDAAPYFIAAGWAEATDEAPVHVYPIGEIDIDPMTTHADGPLKGRRVLEG